MTRLPLELYHKVISYLSDDHQTLKACSLVGQLLISESQKYLFSRVVLGLPTSHNDPRFKLAQFKRYQRLCGMPGFGSSTRFRQLLHTSPHLAEHVECLQIIQMESTDLEDRKAWIAENQDLPQCLAYFHKLKALVICGFRNWNFLPLCSELVRLFSLRSLVCLNLSGCLLPTLVIRAMSPDIKYLSIRTYTHKKFRLPVLPDVSTSSPIRVEMLFIADVGCLRRQEFSHRIDTSGLRKLGLDIAWITCSNRNSEIRDLLEACRCTLEELVVLSIKDLVWQNGPSAIEQYKEPIDLSRLSVLRDLSIGICDINHFWWLNKLLRACLSDNKSLEKITIEVIYDFSMSRVDILHWDEVVDALLGHHYAPLKRLDILIIPPTRTSEAEEVVAMLLASCYIERLRSRQPEGLQVNVVDMTRLPAPFSFYPKRSWLCVAEAGEW